MAELMKRPNATSMLHAVFLVWALIGTPAVFADTFRDPTRPPVSAEPMREGPLSGTDSGPVLQSVILSQGRMMAIISGQTVKLGEKFGDARLIKISESEAVLRTDSSSQTLKLFPGIEKRLMANRASIKPGNRAQPR
jgi:MSHA biogenesis protein MshK